MENILTRLRLERDVVWPPTNPFYHRIRMNKFRVLIMSVTVVPIRLVFMGICFVVSWALAHLTLVGLTDEEIMTKPFSWWRNIFRWLFLRVTYRALFFFAGFHYVEVKGTRATFKEAPIFVVVPHSSYADVLPLITLGAPSVLARSDLRTIPIIGKIIGITQPIYVTRERASSRDKALKSIKARATDPNGFNQIYIYPEGTCSNRSGLLEFKKGAFFPGTPIQPVLIRYSCKKDLLSWTFDGTPVWKTIWYSLTNFRNTLEIEFLPVYTPNVVEQNEPELYMENVRDVISNSLGIPKTAYTFRDGLIFQQMGRPALRSFLRQVIKIRKGLKYSFDGDMQDEMKFLNQVYTKKRVGFGVCFDHARFVYRVQHADIPALENLFKLYVKNVNEIMDLRTHIFHCLLLHPRFAIEGLCELLFVMFSEFSDKITRVQFKPMYNELYDGKPDEADKLFNEHCSHKRGEEFSDEDFLVKNEFCDALKMRLEFAKLFALEALGYVSDYPKYPLANPQSESADDHDPNDFPMLPSMSPSERALDYSQQ